MYKQVSVDRTGRSMAGNKRSLRIQIACVLASKADELSAWIGTRDWIF